MYEVTVRTISSGQSTLLVYAGPGVEKRKGKTVKHCFSNESSHEFPIKPFCLVVFAIGLGQHMRIMAPRGKAAAESDCFLRQLSKRSSAEFFGALCLFAFPLLYVDRASRWQIKVRCVNVPIMTSRRNNKGRINQSSRKQRRMISTLVMLMSVRTYMTWLDMMVPTLFVR